MKTNEDANVSKEQDKRRDKCKRRERVIKRRTGNKTYVSMIDTII